MTGTVLVATAEDKTSSFFWLEEYSQKFTNNKGKFISCNASNYNMHIATKHNTPLTII